MNRIHVHSVQKQWKPESNVVKCLNSWKRKKNVIPEFFIQWTCVYKKKGKINIFEKPKLTVSVICIKIYKSKYIYRVSLVVPWLRIHLPMQGTRVQALVRVCHNYWSLCTYSSRSAIREATTMRSPCTAMKSSPRSLQLEKACVQQQRPNTAKIDKWINKLKKKYIWK